MQVVEERSFREFKVADKASPKKRAGIIRG